MPTPKSDRDLSLLSLRDVAGLIRDGVVSPVEVTRATLDRIGELDGVIGAYVTVLEGEALAAARVAESEVLRGGYRGPLHGIPVSLKDLIFVRGVRATAGSASMADFVPGFDAGVTERLRAAGAVVVGKAQTYEFAMGPGTAYPFGRTRNPWDLERVTIGSSSGSAAGVGAFLCYASIGTDTGGSVRGPASGCGVVGFKPSYGRVSRFGVLPLSWSLDHVGPLARDVVDCALVMGAIEGLDRRDPGSASMVGVDVGAVVGADVRGVRMGVPSEFFFDGVDGEFLAAFRAAVEVLADAGAEIREVSFPNTSDALTAHSLIVLAESYSVHEEHFLEHGHRFGDSARSRMVLASAVSARDYLRAQRVRTVFSREFHQAMAGVDVLLTLTSPTVPHTFDEPPPRDNGRQSVHAAQNRFRRVFNLVGAPAISLPCGFTSSGLPIGLQMVGRPGEDQTVLAAANGYQQLTDWHHKLPGHFC